MAGTASTDRKCQACQPCGAGYRATPAGCRGTTDTVCELCNGMTEFQPLPGGQKCLTVSTCEPGFFVKTEPSPSSDRECLPCAPGLSYSTGLNAVNCTHVTVCAAGEYELRLPAINADRVCAPCNGITRFQDEVDEPQCKAVTPLAACLAADRFQLAAPTPTSDRVCQARSVCDPDSGTFIAVPGTDTSDRVCAALMLCGDGSFQAQAPTLTSNRLCAPCSNCSSPATVLRPCNATHDTVCASARSSASSSSGLSTGTTLAIILPIVVLCLLLLVVAAVVVYGARKKKQQAEQKAAAIAAAAGGMTPLEEYNNPLYAVPATDVDSIMATESVVDDNDYASLDAPETVDNPAFRQVDGLTSEC